MAKSIPIFLAKNEIMQILDSITTNFWNLEHLKKQKSINIYVSLHRRLKNKCHVLLTFYVGTIFAFYLGPFFSEGDVLIYECYRPPWMPYYCIMALMDTIGTLSTLLAMIPVDIFFMSLASLAQIQFKLLNEELESLFENFDDEGEAVRVKIKTCINHHSFLLM